MLSNFEKFKNLHYADKLFILPNAWDAKSAKVLQEKNFDAIATSSSAVSESLGYRDGEGMPLEEYIFVIKRILASVTVPVTVDFEMGYGKTKEEVTDNIRNLITLGVVGINIEDSEIPGSGRILKNASVFAKMIEYVKNKLISENLSLFINLRCDTYLLNVKDKQQETARRLKIYESTGADGFFLPCISHENDIAAAVATTRLPVSVMCIPGLPGLDRLKELGVKRASMGPFLFSKVYQKAGELSEKVIDKKSFSPIL